MYKRGRFLFTELALALINPMQLLPWYLSAARDPRSGCAQRDWLFAQDGTGTVSSLQCSPAAPPDPAAAVAQKPYSLLVLEKAT